MRSPEGFFVSNLAALLTLLTISVKDNFVQIKKIVYYLTTSVLTVIMLYSVQMYLRNPVMVADYFQSVNYPNYLVYPLATAKILGLIAIWANFSKWLKEWAYAGFFFDVTLAFIAHIAVKDGGELFSIIAFVALMISYFLGKTVRP